MPKVSVVIPTKNEPSIAETLRSVPSGDGYETIVVDSSTDSTPEIAGSMGAKVVPEKRPGYGRALRTGFEAAAGGIIATLDGDCTYPAELIPALVEKLEAEGLDFISCNRFGDLREGSMSLTNRIGNRLLTGLANALLGIRLKDSQSGMWVFRKAVLGSIALESDGMPLSQEIKAKVAKSGFRFAEVPIPYRPRKGRAKLSPWKDGLRNAAHILRMAASG
jgi:hypothetical protein